jgi:hypothetical protein
MTALRQDGPITESRCEAIQSRNRAAIAMPHRVVPNIRYALGSAERGPILGVAGLMDDLKLFVGMMVILNPYEPPLQTVRSGKPSDSLCAVSCRCRQLDIHARSSSNSFISAIPDRPDRRPRPARPNLPPLKRRPRKSGPPGMEPVAIIPYPTTWDRIDIPRTVEQPNKDLPLPG